MSVKLINCPSLPNIPWEDKPEGYSLPVWRYSRNPITKRHPVKGVDRIFNSALVPFEGEFAGVFRGDGLDGVSRLYNGHSRNGLDWEFEAEPIAFTDEEGKPFQPRYAYDPRVVPIENGEYLVMWCTDFYSPAIGVAKTKDFKTYTRLENPFLPPTRNAVLFPRRIGGNYIMLSRPSDNGHTPFGDIYLSESPDLTYWGRHKHVMAPTKGWQGMKIGGGAAPIETSEGWLIFYHGVCNTCTGYVYSMGGAILDINEPSRVKYRCRNFLLAPEMPYEETGFVPSVVFPCAALTDGDTGRIAIYYGSADSYVAVAFTTVDEAVSYIIENSTVNENDTESGRI